MTVRRWLPLAILALLSCTGRPRKVAVDDHTPSAEHADQPTRTGTVLELDLTAGAPESTDVGGFFQMPARRTFVGLVRTIERTFQDEDATGVFVRLGAADFGWARSEEVGRLLQAVREQGLPVVCHAHSLSNTTTWLAARGCDRIWLAPGGTVNAIGVAAQVLYFKGVLSKLQVETQFVAAGKYKTAAEGLTREGPSEEARESLTETLGSIRRSWLDSMQTARPDAAHVRQAMEHGPWSAGEAKARGLVDEVGFESDARKAALDRGNASRTDVRFGPKASSESGEGIAELIRILAGADGAESGRPHIVVMPAQGAISMQSTGMLAGTGITARAMTKTIRRLAKDDSVKAVVLRVDSPGGSALASDLLWHELMRLREKKPLIASLGDTAASGGYYLACAANRIVAERTSIIGSIGVVGGKIVFDQALSQYGINAVTFAASPEPGAQQRAAYLSPLLRWDDATLKRMRAQIVNIYDLFLKRVAEGRSLPLDAVRKVAEGRIWSGAQGQERGLVDESGGIHRALELARALAKLDDDAPVRVEGVVESLLELLMLGGSAESAEMSTAIQRLEARQDCALRALPDQLRPFVASVSPLLQGEPMLATLPFALVVR